jgi:RHS repeat-associated protein
MQMFPSAVSRYIAGILSALLLLIAGVSDAQTCLGTRIRYFNVIPSFSAEWYGEWEYYSGASDVGAAQQRACEKFAARYGLLWAKGNYLAANGFSAHGYRNVVLTNNGGGCGFTIYATHVSNGEHTGFANNGNESLSHQCPQDAFKRGGNECGIGNPIDPATGNKYQSEQDYRSADGTLEFTRHYNSQLQAPGVTSPFSSALGTKWRSTYDRAIRRSTSSAAIVYAFRPDGKTLTFLQAQSEFIPDGDITDRLEKIFDASNVFTGWRYRVGSSDEVEIYDTNGRLLTITTRAGVTVTLAYDTSSRLAGVTDTFGKSLSFGYDASNRLSALTVPGGLSYSYSYGTNNNVSGVTHPGGTTRSYAYNEPAYTSGANLPLALTAIFDENNVRYASFSYNNFLRALSTEHAGGVEKYQIQYPSDGASNTRTFTDPLGQARTLTLATVLGVSRVATASSKSNLSCARLKSTGYDVNGNATSAVDFNDNQTTRSYDSARNLEISRTDAVGTPSARTSTTLWHATYRVPSQIDEPGKRTTFTHDANGNVLTRTELDTATSASRTWTYTYNSYGQVLTSNGPRTDVSDVTTYTYYSCTTGYHCGQVHTITNAAGHTTTYTTYNAQGQPLTVTDPNGVVTTLTYDLRQRVTSRTVGAETTTFEYWPTGLLKKATLPDASYLSYTYDAAHRLTEITDSEGNRFVYTLDNMGNRTKQDMLDPSNALTQTRTRVFDTLNRLQREIGAAGSANVTTTFGYDNNGNQTSIAAPLGRDSSQDYDELNRLTHITDPLSGVTEYGYNALDQLISVTDPKGLSTSYSYNALGDLQQQTSPDTGVTTNTYDSGGNLSTSTDARSAVTTHTYDALNRVATSSFTAGATTDQTLTYSYDAGTYGKGRLTGASDANHSLSWTYDEQGRLLTAGQTVGSVSNTTSYAYANGQRQSMTTPSGQVITYGYTNGKITSISVNGTVLVTDVLYDPFGPVRQWEWGSGALSVRTFDQDGKVTQIDSAGLKTYAYDDAFRITGITDTTNSALSWTYGYDDLDRLTSASKTGTTLGYSYDANGNRLTQSGSAASTFTVAANSNRLDSTSGALTRTYGYDNAGNTTSFTGVSFTYNNRGRMKSSTKNAVTTNYTYNALGQLIKKGSTPLYYYDDAGHILGVYNNSGVLIEEIVWLGDIPLATLRPRAGGGIDIYYIHSDHLNTPRLVTESVTPTVRWRWDADPFGGGTVNNNPAGAGVFEFNLRFPGQVYFAETGLYYNYFRDYDPATGRYVQSDPIGLGGGINTYAYVESNPLSGFDALGLETQPGSGRPTSYPKCIQWPGFPGACDNDCAVACGINRAEMARNCIKDCKWRMPFPQLLLATCSEASNEWGRQCLESCLTGNNEKCCGK